MRALAIAEASSAQEAEKETGIPAATIRSWRLRSKAVATDDVTNATLQRNTVPKKIEHIAEEAIESAKAEVKDYVQNRIKQVADSILGLVELSVETASGVIRAGPNVDEPKAAWLRAVIGALGQATEKHQLLIGAPTSRQEVKGEVMTTHEQHYHITQEIIERQPELVDTIFGRGVADRSSPS